MLLNNSDLDNLLKAAESPARSDQYWNQFPKKVTAKIHWQSRRVATLDSADLHKPRRMILVWGLSLVSAFGIIGFTLSLWRGLVPDETALELTQVKKYVREIETLFPNQLQAIIFDEQGARLILAEKPDVPNSAPLYLKICGPGGCQRFVTFSGQRIRVNGDECDVLVDAKGNVMLVGERLLWSRVAVARVGKYRIEARALETSS